MPVESRRADDHAAPAIPYHDLGTAGPLALLDAARAELEAIVVAGRRHYGAAALRFGDALSRRWLVRTGNPYRDEIAAIADRLGGPGAFLLNLSYEWSCTTGVGPDPAGSGQRMLRTLDWPLDGLGRHLVVARRETPAGALLDVTWPGCVGVLTAMAPGRFTAAINQPPLRRRTGMRYFDWFLGRMDAWHIRALPASHLLRQVFETCQTYAEAKARLTETPIAVPAFFTLAGCGDGEGCVIERTETEAAVHPAPTGIANHWLAIDRTGYGRGTDSQGRLLQMDRVRDSTGEGFGWVTPPILNWQTRLAVVANPATGRLLVQGYEADGAATGVFTLPERHRADRPETTSGPVSAA